MPQFETVMSTSIDATPEAVFASVSELGRHGEWAANPLKVEQVSEGPVAVGSEFKSSVHFMGKDVNAAIKVTALDAPKTLGFSCGDSTGSYVHTYSVAPRGNGSEVEHRLRGQVSLVNYIILKTFGIQFIGKPGGRKFFSNLKASVEQK